MSSCSWKTEYITAHLMMEPLELFRTHTAEPIAEYHHGIIWLEKAAIHHHVLVSTKYCAWGGRKVSCLCGVYRLTGKEPTCMPDDMIGVLHAVFQSSREPYK